MAKKLSVLIIALLHCVPAFAQRDTVAIFFPFNESVLTEQAQFHLDSAIYKGVISSRQTLQIIGYADAVGKDSFNLQLSRKRAASVKDYLIASGFRAANITLIMGKGESLAKAAERPGGNLADRRVDIVRTGDAVPPVNAENVRIKVKSVPGGPESASPQRSISVPDISKVAVGETMLLENIYFYAGRHIVRRESDEALNALVDALKANPGIKIRIEGHVCCVPLTAKDAIDDDTGREELSVNRASVIRDYLIAHGIQSERLSFAGFGHRRPIIPFERSEEDANRNRRVEVRVVQ